MPTEYLVVKKSVRLITCTPLHFMDSMLLLDHVWSKVDAEQQHMRSNMRQMACAGEEADAREGRVNDSWLAAHIILGQGQQHAVSAVASQCSMKAIC